MILRFLRWLGLVELVFLEDAWGCVYLTIKRKHPWRGHCAHIYPITRVGHVILKPGGTCEGSSYIQRWKDYCDDDAMLAARQQEDGNG